MGVSGLPYGRESWWSTMCFCTVRFTTLRLLPYRYFIRTYDPRVRMLYDVKHTAEVWCNKLLLIILLLITPNTRMIEIYCTRWIECTGRRIVTVNTTISFLEIRKIIPATAIIFHFQRFLKSDLTNCTTIKIREREKNANFISRRNIWNGPMTRTFTTHTVLYVHPVKF